MLVNWMIGEGGSVKERTATTAGQRVGGGVGAGVCGGKESGFERSKVGAE